MNSGEYADGTNGQTDGRFLLNVASVILYRLWLLEPIQPMHVPILWLFDVSALHYWFAELVKQDFAYF